MISSNSDPWFSDGKERTGRTVRLGESIHAFLRASGLERPFFEQKAIAAWGPCVKERLGDEAERFSRAERVIDGQLQVRVAKDVWRHRLLFECPDLVEALNRRLGKEVVRDVRLV